MDETAVAFARESFHRIIDEAADIDKLRQLTHNLMDYYFTAKSMLAAELLRPGRCSDCELRH